MLMAVQYPSIGADRAVSIGSLANDVAFLYSYLCQTDSRVHTLSRHFISVDIISAAILAVNFPLAASLRTLRSCRKMTAPLARSCLACCRRKVKCDKKVPCSTCVNSGQVCEYPQGPIRRHRARRQDRFDGSSKRNHKAGERSRSTSTDSGGRLIVDGDGKSRFLSSLFWANVEDEDNLQRSILDESGHRPNFYPGSPFSLSFFFCRRFQEQPDRPEPLYDPLGWPPDHIDTCWNPYKNNVDPVVRILHKPNIEKLIRAVTPSGLAALDEASAALVVAICYASVVTLDSRLAVQHFGEEHSTLIRQHEYAVELSMARAGWICSDHIQVLQAFVLVLSCMPREDNRLVWTLTGIALRIATSLALHHDSVDFGLSPFEVDMRARLWRHLCLIDIRVSEDYGTDPSFLSRNGNYRLPLNVNDSDWDVGAKAPPREHQGPTEMTWSLIRFEACHALLRIWAASRPRSRSCFDMQSSTGRSHGTAFEIREGFVKRFSAFMETKYLRFLGTEPTDPLHRMLAETVRAFLIKLRLIVHYSALQNAAAGAQESGIEPTVRNELFLSALELLECHYRLCSAEYMANFKWIATQYSQWHATAFVLSHVYSLLKTSEPGESPLPPEVLGRVLQVIPFAFDETDRFDKMTGLIHRWRPLERLYQRVMKELVRIQPKDVDILLYKSFGTF
ncbi:hypothetical protein VTN96DRAFT_9395 [Rasamsonia emersonii]